MKKAEDAFIESINISEKSQNLTDMAFSTASYAHYLMSIGNLGKSQIYFEKAMLLFQSEKIPQVKVEPLYNYSHFWMLKGNVAKAHNF